FSFPQQDSPPRARNKGKNGFFRPRFGPSRPVVRAMTDASFAIQPRQQAGRVILYVSGDLDLAAREPLLRAGEQHAGKAPVVVDLSDALFIDASVVGAL